MTLPTPPKTYDPRWASELVRALELQQQQLFTQGKDVEVGQNAIWLTSPNGTRYQVQVADNGTLTSAAYVAPPPAAGPAAPPPGYVDGAGVIAAISSIVARAAGNVDGQAAISSVSTLAASGLIISGTANLLQYSQQFHRSVWATTLTPLVEYNVSADPNAQTTVDELTVSYSGSNYVRQHISGLVIGQTYTLSCYVQTGRTGSATNVRLTTNNTSAWSTGASAVYALTGTLTRVSVTWTQQGTTTAALMIGSVKVDGTGDDTCLGKVRLWGAMLNVGATAATYVMTQVDPEPSGGAPADGLPAKIFAAYYETYQSWRAAPYPQITDPRADRYNVLYAFHCKINTDGSARYDDITDTTAAEIQACRTRATNPQKVILTIGGAGAGFTYDTRAKSTILRDSLYSIISTLGGVDGVDWNNYEGDTILTSANWSIVADEFIWLAGQLRATYGSTFVITTPAQPNDALQRSFCQKLFDNNALTLAAPQYYDWDGFRDDYFIKNSIDYWVGTVARGNASKIAVGFGGSYFSPYAPLGGPDDVINEREWNRIKAAYPNIRGMFGWSIHTIYGYDASRTTTAAPDVWSGRMYPLL